MGTPPSQLLGKEYCTHQTHGEHGVGGGGLWPELPVKAAPVGGSLQMVLCGFPMNTEKT